MTTALRKSGLPVVGDLPWGIHFCYFWETKQDLLETVVPYFQAGLANHECCLWVLPETLTEAEARAALRSALPDLDRYLADGSLEFLPIGAWYLQDSVFDRRRVLKGWLDKLEHALARGYAGLRVSGSSDWVQQQDREAFHHYETELNAAIADQRLLVLCTFPLAASAATDILDAARTHQLAVARRHGAWEVVEVPELKQAKAEIQRLNDELEQRIIDRTRELAATNQALHGEIRERQRTEEALKVTSEVLRTLAASVSAAREAERARIARELHDELGAMLTSLRWDLEGIEKLYAEAGHPLDLATGREQVEAMLRHIDASTNTVKRLAADLRPSMLDDLGLVAAIEWQAQQFEARTGIICQFNAFVEEVELTWEQATALFRILQEALTNILRHAQATSVSITLAVEAGEFVLEVRDNGRGITEAEKTAAHALGLMGMRERALLVGGEIEITGVAGKGTVLLVRIPLPNQTLA
jgi:signal transduction histidine kinase